MKEIGIVICNYNKEDYIINCIKSVLASSVDNYDLYVVDNASTDGSVERIKNEFHDKLNLIVNQENLGGSGGFNTGLREALKHDYKYIMLLDNDVVIDHRAIEELYQFLEANRQVGMVGSKVYFMDYPDSIWSCGGKINFDKYIQEDNYKNCVDNQQIPETIYCDYVPACSLLARTEAIKKVGIMPEDNFIYWDDMEWGHRFNLAGYPVAVWGKSKVWHKAGGRNAGDTFINYYMWRNRIRFFMKFLPSDKIEHFAETILTDMYRLIYSCNLKQENNIITSVMYAFDDALHKVNGKAAPHKILKRSNNTDRVAMALGDASSVLILYNGHSEGLGNVIRKVHAYRNEIKITICVPEDEEAQKAIRLQYPECEVVAEYMPENYDFHMKMCEHIFSIRSEDAQDCYIDPWCNIIFTKEDYLYSISFKQSLDLFIKCFKPIIIDKYMESVVTK